MFLYLALPRGNDPRSPVFQSGANPLSARAAKIGGCHRNLTCFNGFAIRHLNIRPDTQNLERATGIESAYNGLEDRGLTNRPYPHFGIISRKGGLPITDWTLSY